LGEPQFDQAIRGAAVWPIAASGRERLTALQPNEAGTCWRRRANGKAAAEATSACQCAEARGEEAKGLASSDVAPALGKLREARGLDSEIEGAAKLANSLGESRRESRGRDRVLGRRKLRTVPSQRNRRSRRYEGAVRLLDRRPGGHKIRAGRSSVCRI
jgi:hypothetical protein